MGLSRVLHQYQTLGEIRFIPMWSINNPDIDLMVEPIESLFTPLFNVPICTGLVQRDTDHSSAI